MKTVLKKRAAIPAARAYFKEKNINFTIERAALFDVLLSMKGPYSAEEFYKHAFRKNAVYARTTVYRTLPLFVQAGTVTATTLPNGRKRYETNFGK